MKRKFLLVCAAVLFCIGISAQTPPTTSTPGNDVWYYIKASPRTNDLSAKWVTAPAAGSYITNSVFSTDDALLWKVVTNGSGIALVNKKYGTYLDADVRYDAVANSIIPCKATVPTTALKLFPYPDQTTAASGVPNGFYLANADAINVSNASNTSLTFCWYSAGVGSNYRPINYGSNSPLIHSAIRFMNAKEVLENLIATATTLNGTANAKLTSAISTAQTVYAAAGSVDADYISASVSLNNVYSLLSIIRAATTGNTPVNSKLTAAIAAAQAVYDAPASTSVEYIDATTRLSAMFNLFGNLKSANTANSPAQAGYTAAITAAQTIYDAPASTTAALVAANDQLYAIITLYGSIKSATTANTPVSAVLTNAISAAQAIADNAGSSLSVLQNANDKLTAVQTLFSGLKTANTLAANVTVGMDPGQYKAADVATLPTYITPAQAVYDNPAATPAEMRIANNTLTANLNIFKSTVILPVISTAGNDRWYYIQGTRPANTYITSPAAGTFTQIKDLVVVPNDFQLWKLVANTNGTANGFAMVNKATGEYLQTDVASGTNLPPRADMPANNLRFIASGEITNKTTRFWIENAVGSTPAFRLHAGGTANGYGIMNWTGGANDNCTWLFVDYNTGLKTIVLELLTRAKAMYDATSEGTNPGQFTKDSRDGLLASIEYAQSVYDDANATSQDCQAAVDDLNLVVNDFKNQAIKPTYSTEGNDHWYYIQGTSVANSYLTAAAAGTAKVVTSTTVVPNDFQLWKLVNNTNGTANGFALVNKATGEYIATDRPALMNTLTAMPTNNLQLVPNSTYANKLMMFRIEYSPANFPNTRFWSDGATLKSDTLKAKTTAIDWTFLTPEMSAVLQYNKARVDARALYTNSVEGLEFGQYTTEARANFDAIVAAEEAKDVTTMSNEEIVAATKATKDAMAAFNCNRNIKTLLSSSVTKYKWFRFVNGMQPSTGYASGKAMSSTNRTVGQKYTYEVKNVNSDAQLFRIELNDAQTAVSAIVNKANGMYVGTDGAIVATAPSVEFIISALDQQTFWIKPTTVGPLHAAAANSDIVNWNAGIGSASAWKFEFVKEEDIADLTNTYVATRIKMRSKHDAASLVSGNEIGQYSLATVNALQSVLTVEEPKDVATLTQSQMLQGILDLNAANSAMKVNTDIALLANNPWSPKWFRLINNMSGTGYASNKVMTSNGRLVTEAYTYEDKDITSEAQLFRFELSTDGTKVSNIINKATGKYVDAYGKLSDASTAGNEFEITQLDGGRSFWIHPTYMDVTDPANPYRLAPLHAAQVGTNIVNWNSGAGSASAWLFEYATEFASVKEVDNFTYKVRIINRIITVEGVENFEVYSILGQRQNIKKALATGVYFVKVNHAVRKVVVE